MTPSEARRAPSDRREISDRRDGVDRREASATALALVPVERRSGTDRRRAERRTQSDRRRHETAEEHIRNALQLLAAVSDSAALNDELQRDLDSAIFRLRFALDRLEHEDP